MRPRSGGERPDLRLQAALVASSLVAMDQATAAETVKQRLSRLVRFLGSGDVLGLKRLDHLLEGGTDHGLGAGVALVALDSLPGALLGGFDVGQGNSPKLFGVKRPVIMAPGWGGVNSPVRIGRQPLCFPSGHGRLHGYPAAAWRRVPARTTP